MNRDGRTSVTGGTKHVWLENDVHPNLALLLVFYVEQG